MLPWDESLKEKQVYDTMKCVIAESKIENTSKKKKYQATIHKRFSAR